VNNQNTGLWASKNLHTAMEILLLEKCIMWCAISTNGLTEVIYLKDIIKKTTVLQLQNKGTTVIERRGKWPHECYL